MNKAETQEIEALYETIVDLFDRKCGICEESYDKKNKKGKRPAFVLHHREYPEGWKKYSDFPMYDKSGKIIRLKPTKRYPLGKIVYDKLSYLRYLIPLIQTLSKEEANRIFKLIHNSHHYAAETIARTRQPKLNKVIELILEINRERYPLDYVLFK